MTNTLRHGAIRKTKNRIINFSVALTLAVTSMSGALPLFLNQKASAQPISIAYSANFNNVSGLGDWTNTVRKPFSAAVPATTGSGTRYGEVTPGGYTKWGGYKSTFPVGGYTSSVDVYLDTTQATGSNDLRFDFSSAINNQAGAHLRDFVFSFGTNPNPATPNQWLVSVGNNTPGNPSAAADKETITTSGWYTLESNFHDNGSGSLVVTMTVKAVGGGFVWTRDITTTDLIATQVGGHRYGWFVNQQVSTLTSIAIDNAVLNSNLPIPTNVYVDPSYSSLNSGAYLWGYNAFSTIEAAMNAVGKNGTVHVADGTYSNVQATGEYANNIIVKGTGSPTINGLNLSGSSFNGLTFRGFKFVGDSAGYGNFNVTIDSDGSYSNLAFKNSSFNGQNNSGRGAIFMNRGFTGFDLTNNTFKNYNDSSSVYSLVFAEAQGPDMGDNFYANGNSLTSANATNFLETYRWKNVNLTYNYVSAHSGRLLVWSDDSQAIDWVNISGNVVDVSAGTGIAVFYAPATDTTIAYNAVNGAATCLKVDSVSDVTVHNNTFADCAQTGLKFGQAGATLPVSASLFSNSFTGSPVGVDNSTPSFSLNASQNYWGVSTDPSSFTTGDVNVNPWCEQADCLNFLTGTQPLELVVNPGGTATTTTAGPTTLSGSTTIGTVTATLAAGTTITPTGPWDGTLNPPTTTSVTVPATPGFTTTDGIAIKVGSDTVALSFDKSAQLTLPGQAGKLVGFQTPGGSFTEITTVCNANDQTAADAQLIAPVNECKMNVGGDLVVWTKHFTTFATFSRNAIAATATTTSTNSTTTVTSGKRTAVKTSTFSSLAGATYPGAVSSTIASVLGTSTTKSNATPKNNTTATTNTPKTTDSAFLGLGWYWLLVLAAIVGIGAYRALGRRVDR